MKDVPGHMTKEEAEKANAEWQRQQDECPGPSITILPQQPQEPSLPKNDFYSRIEERARKREDYMRNGSD